MKKRENIFDIQSYVKSLVASDSIEQVSKVPLPDYGNNNYVFISYSHKDYKMVYSDLAKLYQAGVLFWYDKGLTPGIRWKEEVSQRLKDPKCVGVIFYMSKNLFKSDAVFFEISNTTDTESDGIYKIDKKHFSINLEAELPAQMILSAAAELASDKNVLDIVAKLPKLVEAFPNEETYISYISECHIDEIIQVLKNMIMFWILIIKRIQQINYQISKREL